MCDLFKLNFARLIYKTIKESNKKGVKFIPGEHANFFRCVAGIYREAKELYNIVGLVLVIMAKDEMKVKS